MNSTVLNKWTAAFDFPESVEAEEIALTRSDILRGKGDESRYRSEAQSPRPVCRENNPVAIGLSWSTFRWSRQSRFVSMKTCRFTLISTIWYMQVFLGYSTLPPNLTLKNRLRFPAMPSTALKARFWIAFVNWIGHPAIFAGVISK